MAPPSPFTPFSSPHVRQPPLTSLVAPAASRSLSASSASSSTSTIAAAHRPQLPSSLSVDSSPAADAVEATTTSKRPLPSITTTRSRAKSFTAQGPDTPVFSTIPTRSQLNPEDLSVDAARIHTRPDGDNDGSALFPFPSDAFPDHVGVGADDRPFLPQAPPMPSSSFYIPPHISAPPSTLGFEGAPPLLRNPLRAVLSSIAGKGVSRVHIKDKSSDWVAQSSQGAFTTGQRRGFFGGVRKAFGWAAHGAPLAPTAERELGAGLGVGFRDDQTSDDDRSSWRHDRMKRWSQLSSEDSGFDDGLRLYHPEPRWAGRTLPQGMITTVAPPATPPLTISGSPSPSSTPDPFLFSRSLATPSPVPGRPAPRLATRSESRLRKAFTFPPLLPYLPRLLVLAALFLSSTALVLYSLSTLPLNLPPHLSALSLKEIRAMCSGLKTYSHAGWDEYRHTLLVSALVFTWKQAFSIPGSLIMNVVFGALYGSYLGTLYTSILTAVGGTLSYLLCAPISSLILTLPLLQTPLATLRKSLAAATGDTYTRVQPRHHGLRRRASVWTSVFGLTPTSLSLGTRNTWTYLLLMRLFPLIPYGVMNVAGGVLGVPIPPFAATLAIGSIPWNFVTCQVGDILQDIASVDFSGVGGAGIGIGIGGGGRGDGSGGDAVGGGMKAIVDRVWSRDMVFKLVLLSLASGLPVLLSRRFQPGASGAEAEDLVNNGGGRLEMEEEEEQCESEEMEREREGDGEEMMLLEEESKRLMMMMVGVGDHHHHHHHRFFADDRLGTRADEMTADEEKAGGALV